MSVTYKVFGSYNCDSVGKTSRVGKNEGAHLYKIIMLSLPVIIKFTKEALAVSYFVKVHLLNCDEQAHFQGNLK